LRRLLLIGGGHANAVLLRSLAGKLPSGTRATLVSPSRWQVYTGMLPGHVAGHYALEEIRIDLEGLAGRAGVDVVRGSVTALDADDRTVRLSSGATLAYDVASLNVGALADLERTPGAQVHAVPVKPFDPFLEHWMRLKAEAARRPLRIAVAGAGAGGVEIAMAVAHALPQSKVDMYSEGNSFGAQVARRVGRALKRKGIVLRAASPVSAVEAGPVVVSGGVREAFDAVLWTTGVSAPAWLEASGLALDEKGFVQVDSSLRSTSHPAVFATGDCATLAGRPHPKSGVYAVRHGKLLSHNVPALLREEPLREYSPQRRALMLLSCGDRYAIASWGGLSAEGAWAWRWKDRIDRGWIESFR
jgi:selenide,water dikinase